MRLMQNRALHLWNCQWVQCQTIFYIWLHLRNIVNKKPWCLSVVISRAESPHEPILMNDFVKVLFPVCRSHGQFQQVLVYAPGLKLSFQRHRPGLLQLINWSITCENTVTYLVKYISDQLNPHPSWIHWVHFHLIDVYATFKLDLALNIS